MDTLGAEQVLGKLGIAVIVLTVDGPAAWRIGRLNTAAATWLGLDAATVTGQAADRGHLGASAAFLLSEARRCLTAADEVRALPRLRLKTGWRWCQTTFAPLVSADGTAEGVVGTLVDVTERQTELLRLQQQETQYKAMAENSPDIIARIDRDFRHVYVNRSIEAATGMSAATFIGKDHLELGMPPELVTYWQSVYREVFDTGLEGRKDFTFPSPTGPRYYASRVVPEFDANGRVETVLSVARDVTALRLAENERLEMVRKLEETQRLESLGILAGGVAHDFNNLLTGILGRASLARTGVPPGSRTDSDLQQIEIASLSAANLCRQLLDFSGRGQFQVTRLALEGVVAEMADLLRVSVAKHVALHLVLPDGTFQVMADPTQVQQVVLNLVINASEAIGTQPGTITLRLASQTVPADGPHPLAGLAPGDYVVLTVSDDGCGMAPETVGRIFDPFFTTKFTGRGLGLAATQGIVRSHGGLLHVESQPAVGTTFALYLPLAAGPVTRIAEPTPEPAWKGRGTVLIVDDEETVVAVARRIAEEAGLQTLLARDGQEAVAAFLAHAPGIDAVLLDLTMPGQGGEATLGALRRHHPTVPVILMSGYSEQSALRAIQEDPATDFIRKPFTQADLTQAFRRALS